LTDDNLSCFLDRQIEENPMNAPLEDKNSRTHTAFNRDAWRGIGVLGASIIVYVGLLFFLRGVLPQPILSLVGLIGMLALCFGVLGFAWWLAPRSPLMQQVRPAGRRYMVRFLPAMLVYSAVFIAATWYYRHMHPTGWDAVLTGLAPSVPVLFAIRAMMQLLKEETDEYLRSRLLEGWALATGMVLALCTVWGFLDQFRVVPHLALWAVFPLWACCLIPAHLILNKRYS
jgi:hypothetical protein